MASMPLAAAGTGGPAPQPERGVIAGLAAQSLALARQRVAQLIILFIALPLVLAGKLVWLGVVKAQPATAASGVIGAPPRADIVDRNGFPLARTYEAFAITVEPKLLVGEPVLLANRIAAILGETDPGRILRVLTADSKFQYIIHRVSPGVARRINDLGEPAIYVRREADRLYPNSQLAAHVLGYTNAEGKGAAGLEAQFETRLADPKLRSKPLVTSLDKVVQQALEDELGQVFIDQKARRASGVIMDINTGEVLAMASYPNFNPNRLQPGDETQFNNVTGDVFELGSTMKAITIASGLEAGTITSLSKQYDATRPYVVPGKAIKDHRPPQNRWLTVPEIFVHSSNIGSARIAEEVGKAGQVALFDKLGFFRPVDIELPERVKPRFQSQEQWTRLSMLVISYGQSIDLSLLHMANAYAALANGGIFHSATLLKRDTPPPGRRVFKPETSAAMLKLMRLVVTNGTGKNADAIGYRVGGKTGTAARRQDNGRYNDHSNISNFAAVFPVDAPRYVMMAMVEDPQGSATSMGQRTAGWVIAPAVKRIIERVGPKLGLTPDTSRDLDTSGLLPRKAKPAE